MRLELRLAATVASIITQTASKTSGAVFKFGALVRPAKVRSL